MQTSVSKCENTRTDIAAGHSAPGLASLAANRGCTQASFSRIRSSRYGFFVSRPGKFDPFDNSGNLIVYDGYVIFLIASEKPLRFHVVFEEGKTNSGLVR